MFMLFQLDLNTCKMGLMPSKGYLNDDEWDNYSEIFGTLWRTAVQIMNKTTNKNQATILPGVLNRKGDYLL